MPFGFGRKSASPDVIRMRSDDSKSGKKIPSLTEQINKSRHHLSCDVLPTDIEIASHPPSRYSLDSNNGPSFTTFRSGVSISSPNLAESPAFSSKNRNSIQRHSELTGGPNVCPTCSVPFNEQVKRAVIFGVVW